MPTNRECFDWIALRNSLLVLVEIFVLLQLTPDRQGVKMHCSGQMHLNITLKMQKKQYISYSNTPWELGNHTNYGTLQNERF